MVNIKKRNSDEKFERTWSLNEYRLTKVMKEMHTQEDRELKYVKERKIKWRKKERLGRLNTVTRVYSKVFVKKSWMWVTSKKYLKTQKNSEWLLKNS